jgi:hypothetical protein
MSRVAALRTGAQAREMLPVCDVWGRPALLARVTLLFPSLSQGDETIAWAGKPSGGIMNSKSKGS